MVNIKHQNFKKNAQLYIKIVNNLKNTLEKSIPINHVGSTAIPNMYGKNIIDILIGACDNIQFEHIKQILEENNFIASARSNDGIYQFFSSTPNETKAGDIHIHLVIENTGRYDEFIILKNYLLLSKEEATKYSQFKRDLVKRNIVDRKEYRKIKSEYVSDLIKSATNNLT